MVVFFSQVVRQILWLSFLRSFSEIEHFQQFRTSARELGTDIPPHVGAFLQMCLWERGVQRQCAGTIAYTVGRMRVSARIAALLRRMLGFFFPQRALAHARPGDKGIIRGTVVPRDLIESPLTGESCVYYNYTVERYRTSNVVGMAGEGFWEVRDKDEAIAEFYVAAGNQRAIVSPLAARVERGRRIPTHRVPVDHDDHRAQQLIIRPGDTVEIRGVVDNVNDLHDETRDYRSSPTRIMLRAPDSGSIVIKLVSQAAATTNE